MATSAVQSPASSVGWYIGKVARLYDEGRVCRVVVRVDVRRVGRADTGIVAVQSVEVGFNLFSVLKPVCAPGNFLGDTWVCTWTTGPAPCPSPPHDHSCNLRGTAIRRARFLSHRSCTSPPAQ